MPQPAAELTLARVDHPEQWLPVAMPALSSSEREAALAMPDLKVRALHAVGRALLRLAGAEAQSCTPSAVDVACTPAGKPVIHGRPTLHVSVAHTGSLVAVASCRSAPVGIDAEPRESPVSDPRRLAARLFHSAELAELSELSDVEVPAWFSSLWTIKEAVGKALGVGMVPALRGTTVLKATDGFQLARVDLGPPAEAWTLHQLTMAPPEAERIAVALPARSVLLAKQETLDLRGFTNRCAAAGA